MESTTKEVLNAPPHESTDHSVATKEPVSCVDDQIKDGLANVTRHPVSHEETMVSILTRQANQIQAITELLAQHNRVIGVFADHMARGDGDMKSNVYLSGAVHAERVAGPSRTPTVPLVGSQHQGPTKGLGDEVKNSQRSNEVVHSGQDKHRVRRTVRRGASKDVNKEVKPPALKRKLEFREEEDSDFGELRNIRQRGHGSPFTFYTHTGWQMTSEDMPKCMDTSFWPPPRMQFFGHELAVAAYVFAEDLDQSEILVQNDHCVGNREALWTLRPGEEVVDDIINLIVAMSTAGKDQHRWWLPTTFSQIALNPAFHCKSTLDYIKAKYMGLADNLLKIYVPLHAGGHWYLMIVDMWEEKLVYLDSLKCNSERERRINQMIDVARFIDHILADKGCYENENVTPKKVSRFRVFEPLVSQQDDDSMDCGVWISQWMILSHLWASYELEEVKDSTRMALAIDLVMGSHNPIAEEVAERARRYWDRSNRASYKKGNRQVKNAISPKGPLSPTL